MPVVELSAELRSRVLDVAETEGRLAATKWLRHEAGCSLSEALVAVRQIESESGRQADGTDRTMDEIADLLAAGRKIAAIKLLRERRGVSLRDAKEGVEAIAAGLGIDDGGPSPAAAAVVFGALAAVVIGCVVAALLAG